MNDVAKCRSLTRLCLDNNFITKIENLDHLVNLTWLDLSFNSITKIQVKESYSHTYTCKNILCIVCLSGLLIGYTCMLPLGSTIA